jgi:hypothetical protein
MHILSCRVVEIARVREPAIENLFQRRLDLVCCFWAEHASHGEPAAMCDTGAHVNLKQSAIESE